MPTQLQFRRGTTAQNNAFTGAAGEISVDETIDTIRLHDGITAGGHEITQNAASQTLTNKTLTSPVISTISNSGTLTLPTSTDTLVGRATTDTLTNKTLTSPTISAPTITGNATGVNLTLSGDLTVNGTTTTVASTNTVISDNLIELNNGAASNANDSGIVIERGSTGDNAFMGWDESADKFIFGTTTATGASTGDLTISSGTVVASTFEGALSGNASTATALETARTIGGVSFDGTANIDLPGVNTTGNQNTSGSAATLTTARAIALDGAVTGTANFDGSAGITITTTATSDPTITLSGAVTGSGTLTNLGDVTIATTATADPTLTLAGDLSGSATFTNLGDATLTATIAANSVALGTDTTGNYVAAGATSGSGISGSVSSEGGTFTVTSNATSSNTANTIVFRDGSGNFTAGVVTATATAARYADLAERYTSDGDYGPGTVVVFGGDAEVTQSTQRLSKKVAGIVSTDPAFLMNESLEDGVSVGLVGRVPCKVVGEISKGDMMVTSSVIGHAEAWREEGDPPMGTVIGKALENKTGLGEDVIEVVVGRM